jgi:undecaprenyl-phosphate 4-deoxy-4-formamido-L-arabinose transferase
VSKTVYENSSKANFATGPLLPGSFLTKVPPYWYHEDSPMSAEGTTPGLIPELSLVIPVYNGSETVGLVVERIHTVFASMQFEIVLVNDGSEDDSEVVCGKLAKEFPQTVTFVQLSRNFGEHSAVLAGLNHARGKYVAVLDDDGQNPPEEVVRMLEELKRKNYDVVYGHYIDKQHSRFRNAGSRFNDRMATLILDKPKDLYLSSFKVMTRFVVDEIIKYRGPFPYIDGLIYRTTRKIGQIPVEHRANIIGRSRYTFRKLVGLWLNMSLNFSIAPLRLAVYVGLISACLSVVALVLILIDKIWIAKNLTVGIPTILGSIVLFSGIHLMMLGILGEYLGRLYLGHTGTPQYVVRYTARGDSKPEPVSAFPSGGESR